MTGEEQELLGMSGTAGIKTPGRGRSSATAQGDAGVTQGKQYEQRVEQGVLAPRMQRLGFLPARVAISRHTGTSSAFHRVIHQAITGRSLDREDSSIFDADLIICSGDDRYALCGISVTADTEDISRAAERAEIPSKTLKCQVTPVIVADTGPEPQ